MCRGFKFFDQNVLVNIQRVNEAVTEQNDPEAPEPVIQYKKWEYLILIEDQQELKHDKLLNFVGDEIRRQFNCLISLLKEVLKSLNFNSQTERLS